MYKKLSLLAVAIIVIAGSIWFFYPRLQHKTDSGVACTMEALLCPDGSYVSRQGPNCAFAACPSTGPITGTLKQVPGNFQLITASPDTTTQEVSYTMPLRIKVTNVLAQFIGKKVQVFGTFSEGNTFDVDHLQEVGNGDPTQGTVAMGQSAYINGVRITLNAITQDSRCPVDVQCIQAGSVTANVTLKSDTDKETTNIRSGAAPIGFDSFMISLMDVSPARVSSHEPDGQSYVLTFTVAAR